MDALRNIGILAHVDAGKTTLTEQLLLASGEIRRAGRVDDGDTRTDRLAVERARGISVTAAPVSMMWRDVRINLIDTPGHVDFAGEVERSLRAVDGVVLLLSAVEGIQAQTEVLWDILRKNNVPTILFINKTDRTGSDYAGLSDELREAFSRSLLPLCELSGEETNAVAVNAVAPDVEAVAERDDALLERYLAGDALSDAEITASARKSVAAGELFPLLCGSAMRGVGIKELLDAVVDYFPPPQSAEGDFSAVVFKLEHDKTMGATPHVRVWSGEIKNTDRVALPDGNTGRVAQIRRPSAGKTVDVGHAAAGDIVSLCGLGDVRPGEWIGTKPDGARDFRIAEPLLRSRVTPVTDQGKTPDFAPLVAAMRELESENPLLRLEWQPDERELVASVTGLIELEILPALLRERFGIEAAFEPPSVIYKETPMRAAYGFDAYTMPKPCWAILRFLIEPMPRGFGFEYGGHVPNDKMFYRYQEHVRQAVPGTLKQGLHGWEVTDLKVTLVDGQHHTIHTHPLDFFTCTPMAMRDGYRNCGMKLLEPYVRLRATVPEELAGKVIRDVIAMRGEYDSPVVRAGRSTVEAFVPVAESMDYSARLGILTGGRGVMSVTYAGYRDCPDGLGRDTPYRGIDPLDRSKYILWIRGAITQGERK